MKKLLAVSAVAVLGFSSAVFAGGLPEEMPVAPSATSDTGLYVGVESGWGMTNWKDQERGKKMDNFSGDRGFVSRFSVGYDVSRHFAVEAGYTYFFNKVERKIFGFEIVQKVNKTQNFDVMGKIKAPVVDNFDLYVKLGVNYLMSDFEDMHNKDRNKRRKSFNVAFGAGADYYITQNVIANVGWLRFNGKSKRFDSNDAERYQPYADAFMVGVKYRFDI